MAVDFIGLLLVLLCMLPAIICFFSSLVMVRRISYTPLQSFAMSVAFLLIWLLTFLPDVLASDPQMLAVVRLARTVGFIAAMGFGLFLVIGMAAALSSDWLTKSLVMLSIFFTGGAVFISLVPGAWDLELTNAGWKMIWQPYLILALVPLLVSWGAVLVDYLYEVMKALRRSRSRLYRTTAPLLLFSFLMLLFAGSMVVVGQLLPAIPRLTFMAPLAVALWGVAIASWANPTVLVITAPRIHYLFLLDMRNGLPLFVYDFREQTSEQDERDLELISTILGAVKTVLGEITSSMKKIKSISTPFGEMLVEEMGPVGSFLLTDGEVSVTRRTLRYCTKEFLSSYRGVLRQECHESSQFGSFSSIVKKYFDFAF